MVHLRLWRVDDALLGGNEFELAEVRPSHALVGIASAILELEPQKADAEIIPCEYPDALWSGFGDSGGELLVGGFGACELFKKEHRCLNCVLV